MNILGINCFSHDTAVALLQDGKLKAFAEEERFNREKHTKSFPEKTLNFCLNEGNISLNQVDYVVFPFRPLLDYGRALLDVLYHFPFSYKRLAAQTYVDWKLLQKVRNFRKKYNYQGKILLVGHHVAHAASAFFASPFEQAAILSIDRGGDYVSTLLALGKDREIKPIRQIKNPHSLGEIYSAVTEFLGFKPNSDEGKVMGLAPYGKLDYFEEFQRMVKLRPQGEFRINFDYFRYHLEKGFLSRKFLKVFGNPRKPESEITRHHQDLAAGIQKISETAALHLANYLYHETKLKTLCLAGGVALNSVMNAYLLKETPFERVYIQPAAGDAGTALGAVLYLWHSLLGKPREETMSHAYYGPNYSQDQIEGLLKKRKLPYQKLDNPTLVGAQLLGKGRTLGWFQGRMEVGPRALGNRSILADPRVPDMKDILNSRVKFREGFRPYAPAVLEEEAPSYFEDYHPSPFMLLVLPVKKDKQKLIPAVTHVDGTGRVQTVERGINPIYFGLIEEFQKLTGVPIILNTSFNVRGEPIVMKPEEALNCYFSTGLEALILGNYLLTKGDFRKDFAAEEGERWEIS